MFKLFLGLMAFACCIYIIGLIVVVIGAVFELIFQYWWVLALVISLAVVVYFYRSNKIRKKKIQQARKLHEEIEKHRLAALSNEQETGLLDSTPDPSELDALSVYETPDISVRNSGWLDYGGVEAELLNVDLMEGHKFEYWCAALLRENGFQNVEVTQASGDDGVDILAEKDNVRYAIQCKRYNTHLGNTPIQEVHAGKSVYNCHVGAVMTNQYFTEGGRRVAAATGTLLWDRDWLRARISEAESSTAQTPSDPPPSLEELQGDEMLPACVDIVLETGVASVSMLQRRFKLGYARAARIIDEMEEKGFIGPFQGSKPRTILITKQEWDLQRKQWW